LPWIVISDAPGTSSIVLAFPIGRSTEHDFSGSLMLIGWAGAVLLVWGVRAGGVSAVHGA
jgi:hypothetical protein